MGLSDDLLPTDAVQVVLLLFSVSAESDAQLPFDVTWRVIID